MSAVNITFHNILEVAWGKFDREQDDISAPRVLEMKDASGVKHTIAVFPARNKSILVRRNTRVEEVESDTED